MSDEVLLWIDFSVSLLGLFVLIVAMGLHVYLNYRRIWIDKYLTELKSELFLYRTSTHKDPEYLFIRRDIWKYINPYPYSNFDIKDIWFTDSPFISVGSSVERIIEEITDESMGI